MKKRPIFYHGLLLLDKDPGFTSHDAVALVRRLTGQKRVGHCGTLDPMATGLLLVVLGDATRLEPYLVKLSKLYEGRFQLGLSTDSNDLDGNIIERCDGPWPNEDELKAYFRKKEAEREQLPPAFSAVKVDGRRAHKAARAGELIKLKAREVTAFDLNLLSYTPPEASFSAHVSSGYYIRSLVRDIGDEACLGACLTGLRRLKVGSWSLEEAFSIDEIKGWTAADWAAKIISPEAVLPHMPSFVLQAFEEELFRHGRPVELSPINFEGFSAHSEEQALNQCPSSECARPRPLEGLEYKVLNKDAKLVGIARLDYSKNNDFSTASLGGLIPLRPYLRPVRVFNFGSK